MNEKKGLMKWIGIALILILIISTIPVLAAPDTCDVVNDIGSQNLTPNMTAGPPGSPGTTSHNLLVNLTGDDHPQYARTDGTRVFTGSINGGQWNASNFSNPVALQDLVTLNYVQVQIGNLSTPDLSVYLPLNGTSPMRGGFNAGAFNISNVSDPIEAQDAVTKNFLEKTVGNISAGGGTGGAIFYFHHETSPDPSWYEGLSTIPAGESEVDESVSVSSGTGVVKIDAYVTDNRYHGITVIPAGLWRFRAFHYVNNNGGTTQAVYKVYNRTSSGAETYLFTATSVDIDATTPTEYLTSYVQTTDYTVAPTDRLVVNVSAQTTSVSSKTFHFVYEGSTHTSHVQSPIEVLSTLYVMKSGATPFEGSQSMGYHNLTNVTTVAAGDAVCKTYVDTAIAGLGAPDLSAYLPLNGTSPMRGKLDAGRFNISNVSDPVFSQDAATRNYVLIQKGNDTAYIAQNNASIVFVWNTSYILTNGARAMAATLNMGSNIISNVITGVDGGNAVNKTYVDAAVASVGGDTTQFYWINGSRALTGWMNANAQRIYGLVTGTTGDSATNKTYVDAADTSTLSTADSHIASNKSEIYSNGTFYKLDNASVITADGAHAFTGSQSMGNKEINNLVTGTDGGDAVNKTFVDVNVLSNTTIPKLVGGLVPTSNLGTSNANGTVFLAGDQTWKFTPGNLTKVTVYTSGTGTFTTRANTTKIFVRIVGGGGGGGGVSALGSNAAAAGGGGSGAYLEKYVAVSASTGYTYYCGQGGAGGASGGANTGASGYPSNISIGGTLYNAPGGSGGVGMAYGTAAASAAGGAGGSIATNGDLNVAGQPGVAGWRLSGTQASSGSGASCTAFGGGGAGRTSQGTGNAGAGNGAGGGGAQSTGSAYAGGAGSAGAVIIWEFT